MITKDTFNELLAEVAVKNRELFRKKNRDYGCSWMALRYSKSFTDQIFIKAKRIRTVQETKENRVGDSLAGEFIGMLNYVIMAMIKHDHESALNIDTPVEQLMEWFDEQLFNLETFRTEQNTFEGCHGMRIISVSDLILQKLLRVKKLEDGKSAADHATAILSSLKDVGNYALFALVLIETGSDPML